MWISCRNGDRGPCAPVRAHTLVLAAVRRMMRPADAAPLGTIRSLAFFLPVIEEVLELKVGREYFQYLHHKLQRAVADRLEQWASI